MREIRSYGSVGERGGNEPLYPELNGFSGLSNKDQSWGRSVGFESSIFPDGILCLFNGFVSFINHGARFRTSDVELPACSAAGSESRGTPAATSRTKDRVKPRNPRDGESQPRG